MAQNMWLTIGKIGVFLIEIMKILTEVAALISKGRLFHKWDAATERRGHPKIFWNIEHEVQSTSLLERRLRGGLWGSY